MEKIPEQEKTEEFNFEKSPLKDAYVLLGARTPVELSNLYADEDQKLMHARAWDYNNSELVVNKVKRILESVDSETLTEDEQEWRLEILWFWNHHAISCALWRYKDKGAAQEYAAKALEYQPLGHPNQITKLLDFLVNDRVEDAQKWAETISEEPEKSTARSLLEDYKEGRFFPG